MAYRVLKPGVSQQLPGSDDSVDFKVGDIIEVSDGAADYMVPEGFIELVTNKPAAAPVVVIEEEDDNA